MKGKIEKLNRYDTRALVKITEWKNDEVLTTLKQHSTVDGEWFTREVLIGGKLHQLLDTLQEEGSLKLEQLSSHHNPSEKERQIARELEVDNLTGINVVSYKCKGCELFNTYKTE